MRCSKEAAGDAITNVAWVYATGGESL